jgi:hypothetical protein
MLCHPHTVASIQKQVQYQQVELLTLSEKLLILPSLKMYNLIMTGLYVCSFHVQFTLGL